MRGWTVLLLLIWILLVSGLMWVQAYTEEQHQFLYCYPVDQKSGQQMCVRQLFTPETPYEAEP